MKGKGPAEKNEDEEMWYQEQSWISKIFDPKRVQQKRKAKKVQWSRKKSPSRESSVGRSSIWRSGAAVSLRTVTIMTQGDYHQSPVWQRAAEGSRPRQQKRRWFWRFLLSRRDVDSGWGGPGERKLLGFTIRATRTNLYTNRRPSPLPCAVWAQLSLHAAACSWFLYPYSVCPPKKEKDTTTIFTEKGSLTMQSSMRTKSHFLLLSDSKPPPCESTFNTCVKN